MPDLIEQCPFPRLAETVLDDHVISVSWSQGVNYLAAMPSEGRTMILQPGFGSLISLPPHRGGNGSMAWHPISPVLATCGHDHVVRLFEAPFKEPLRTFEIAERGWTERLAWNSHGTLLAAASGRSVHILDPNTGETRTVFSAHKSTVSDIAWSPIREDEFAVVCDGGLRIWRVGSRKPVGSFDWVGSSLKVSWSPDGRWIVTGDQTPGVHVYEVATDIPLHIQGFNTRTKVLAWQGTGEWLAIAAGPLITVWPFTGEKGPNGAKPIPLQAHHAEVTVLQFITEEGLLLSCGRDGVALLWQTHENDQPALLLHKSHGFSAASLAPGTNHLATGDESGEVIIWNLITKKSH